MSFKSPNRAHYLNLMRYYGVFIENTCCHQPPSTMTQSIMIYNHIKVLLISQSFMLTLAKAQYLFKVENPCSIVA